MKTTRKDRIVIKTKEGISIRYFEITEEKEAREYLNLLNSRHNDGHKIETINAYWYNGIPSQRIRHNI